jgi:hypothetical protein
MSLKLVKMNEIKKNKWFQQAITMKTIIPESYNSNGAVLRCKQHLYILMIENIVPIYRLEYSDTPFGSPGKNLAHIFHQKSFGFRVGVGVSALYFYLPTADTRCPNPIIFEIQTPNL